MDTPREVSTLPLDHIGWSTITGLDYLTGLLDWTTGLDYWTGLLHGLDSIINQIAHKISIEVKNLDKNCSKKWNCNSNNY